MAEQRIRIVPKRRDVDAARLAEALLNLVDQLSESDKARYLAEGKRVLDEIKEGGRPKGSAA